MPVKNIRVKAAECEDYPFLITLKDGSIAFRADRRSLHSRFDNCPWTALYQRAASQNTNKPALIIFELIEVNNPQPK